ncbi:transmembrane protein 145 [Leucoraja erinacea]|uniref:transmembrane protein 145 n=1 Tax=Leucoraja erinaceus TaxID=7782 RepID=UPI002458AE03|nr:transmembrane protein 145 [Leucoraja erinacea]
MRGRGRGRCCLLLLCWLRLVCSKFEAGKLDTDQNWIFLTKFCFLPEKGQISYHIRYPKEKHEVNLLFYYDDKNQWPSVYKNSSKNCWSKEVVAANGNNQLFNLTDGFALSGCQVVDVNGINYTDCQKKLNFHSARERWWFLAASNCRGGGITLEYKIKMSNGNSLWRRQFSANQIGILEVHILSVLLFVIVLGVCIYFAYYLKRRHLLHSSYQMLMVSIGTEVLGHFFLGIHFGIYALNGVGCESVKIIGCLLLVISYLLLVPMLLLMSHGFTITRTKIRHSSAVAICLVVVTFAIMYTWFFIDEKHLIDPGRIQSLFESSVGYAMTTLQFLAAFWFIQSTYKIMQEHPEKRPFYLLFFPAFTFWFFAVPVSSLFGQFMIPNWKRERVMSTVLLLLKFYVYAVMLFLTRPFQTNARFPFHIDTSRIALMRYASESQESFVKFGRRVCRNISVTSFINRESRGTTANGPKRCTLQEDADMTRDLLERTNSQIDCRFEFAKMQETNLQI